MEFKVTASGLSGLLGMFGPYKQYNAFCQLLRTSSLQVSLKQSVCPSQSEHIERLEIQQEWANLHTEVSQCQWQSEIQRITDTGFKLLFWNKFMDDQIKSTPIEEEGVMEVLQNVVRCPDKHRQSLDTLKSLPARTPQFQRLLDYIQRSSMCYRFLHSTVCRKYGIRGERTLIDLYNRLHDDPITKVTKRFQEPLTAEDGSWRCLLTGQIDGMQQGKVIEIKHRTTRIFTNIPTYELIQLHMYMFFTKTKSCKLLQCIQLPDNVYVEQTVVYFCDQLWAQITATLVEVIQFAKDLCASRISVECFEQLPEDTRHAMLAKYIPSIQINSETYNKLVNT
uniref:YqaJ viral recombinase domain-containing protein n=1 Tax=viral metagenome TaxID=1070528 RepID=A0A6C0BND6_9ZZZZ